MNWLQSIKRLLTEGGTGQRPTARILSEQIHVSLRLLPVALIGQIIGAVGTTAAAESGQPHLHFAVTKDGKAVDPNEYLSG